jgi:hypothetical protein
VTTNDDGVGDDTFNEEDSEVLSRSGIEEVPERLAIENNFDKAEEQISFEVSSRSRRYAKSVKKQTSLVEKEREEREVKENEKHNDRIIDTRYRKSKSFEDCNIDGLEAKEINESSKAQEPSLEANAKKLNVNNNSNESNHSDKNNSYSYDSEIPRFGL